MLFRFSKTVGDIIKLSLQFQKGWSLRLKISCHSAIMNHNKVSIRGVEKLSEPIVIKRLKVMEFNAGEVNRCIGLNVAYNDCTGQEVLRHVTIHCCCRDAQQLVLIKADDLEATLTQDEVTEELLKYINGMEELESI